MCGLPNWLEVEITREAGPCCRATLQGRGLLYETWQGSARASEFISPTPQRWRDFLTALEEIGLPNWDSEYPSATAATRWHIEIAAPARQLSTCGADNYPPAEAFPRFCAAMSALLGGREFA